ncbi:hypothetical protein Ocin01_16294 [Orchesella cincta]|uniref:F-box domain-containing protein n=1 Tax=Orchesella cincta TaxID=48709 RepID=A0A1D2MBT0_ORCCI|nr:hypothetical protein Ocin01_16294 [Orchesella cincta]
MCDSINLVHGLLPELWEKVFEYLPDPEDFHAVINTCLEWHDLLEYQKTERLIGKTLSVLVGKGYSHPIYEDRKRNLPAVKTLLNLRQVNSEWRKEADKLLNADPKQETYVHSVEHVDTFMEAVKQLSSQHGNPFLGRELQVYRGDAETAEALQRLLNAHGKYLRNAALTLRVITPKKLSEYLALVPFIEDLTIDGVIDISDDEGNETRPTEQPVPFPPLSKLAKLDITQFWYPSGGNEENGRLFSSFLGCCSESLTVLRLNADVLKIPGINELIPNVKELFVFGPLYAAENPLVLSNLRIGLERVTILSIVEPILSFFATLNNFRNTLAYLSLSVRVNESFDPAHLPMLPNLKGLLLYVRSNLKNVPTDTLVKLSLVPASFQNLEFLAIMFDRAFQDIDLTVASEKIRTSFKRMKTVRLVRAEDGDSRY